jgi:GNAT superfamily N-acetyltransferase
MGQPREPKFEEYSRVLEFLNKTLRPHQGWSINEEYPLAMNSQNLHNVRIIEEDGQIVSHALLKILLLKTPIAIFRVAAIGSVVTHPNYQNRGYSTQILNDCLDLAKQQGADFAILWTDIFEFYRRVGFELAGSEVAVIFNQQVKIESEGLRFLDSKKVDPQSLLRLYSQHNMGTLRNASDINDYLKIPNSQLFTAWDQQNQLQSYAVIGRGADLENYIHEWGGGVSKMLALISEIQKKRTPHLTLITHPQAVNLIRKSQEHGALTNQGYLGMIKIISPQDLFFK